MELTRITKLLLWLLSEETGHRGAYGVRDPEPTDYSQDLDLTIDELYADLTPDEQRLLQVDYFEDCFHKSLDDSAA